MHRNLLFTLLFLGLFYSANSQISIKGVILDYSTKKPISGVAIFISQPDTILLSAADGTFKAEIKSFSSEFILKHIAYTYVDSMKNFQCINEAKSFCDVQLFMIPKNNLFQPVEITANRVENTTAVTYTNISGQQLNKNNFGEDMPFLLESTPSAVVTSDAGNGVGYTGIRIRGSDATRVNISINGVPYNDGESQQTYWVDLPDFASSVDDIQIQRGVGTSTYGISSLGASINIFTNRLDEQPFSKINFSVGSFNLFKTSAAFGTGKIKEHWYFEGRLSKVASDGYIDRSHADLSSFFITSAYKSKSWSSILNIFSGEEHTYQAWGGVPIEILDTNRTYNPYTYKNQTDNYIQTHYQWHNNFYLKHNSEFHVTLNYTKGSGYYEQFEEDQNYSDYGVNDVVIGTDTISSTNLITQKWLDNIYTGAYAQYSRKLNSHLKINGGIAFYYLSGAHFGNVIWAENAQPFGIEYTWYDNDAEKLDGNIFAQLFADYDKFKFFLDLQTRQVNYNFLGVDQFGSQLQQQVDLLFFNPKFGVTWVQNSLLNSYLYFGKSSKEPNRDDYVESSPLSRPSPETLYNVELGEKVRYKGWQVMANVYYMYYQNQLVLTGQLNDVGAYTRTNVPTSYRSGVEIAWSKLFYDRLKWNANFSLSKNVIPLFTEYVDNWDDGSQTAFTYANTDIAFSPAVIAYNELEYIFYKNENRKINTDNNFALALNSKFVGKQYADNTKNTVRSIDSYFLNDIILSYTLESKLIHELRVSAIVQNVLNTQYESNAWVYRYIYEQTQNQLLGYYPQAGRNWILSINCAF